MARSSFTNAQLWCIAILAIALTACGASNFDRADAISTLQTAGATTSQATCIADTLITRDQLDAADPRSATSPEEVDSLSAAKNFCVTTEVLPTYEVEVELNADEAAIAALSEGAASDDYEEIETRAAEAVAQILAGDPEVLRQKAINRLIVLGRNEENATCVVDYLVAQQATDILISADLGLGLDIREASAFAACP